MRASPERTPVDRTRRRPFQFLDSANVTPVALGRYHPWCGWCEVHEPFLVADGAEGGSAQGVLTGAARPTTGHTVSKRMIAESSRQTG